MHTTTTTTTYTVRIVSYEVIDGCVDSSSTIRTIRDLAADEVAAALRDPLAFLLAEGVSIPAGALVDHGAYFGEDRVELLAANGDPLGAVQVERE